MAEQNAGPPAQPPQPQATQPQPPAPTLPPDAAKVEAGSQRPDAAKRADGPTADTTQRAEGQRAETGGDKPPKQDPTNQQQTPQRDATRELLDTLALSYGRVSQIDRLTAQAIQEVVRQGSDPARHADTAFRHQLAYTVQDTEKALRTPISMPAELRIEMVDRAGSAPGLENERMLALMRSTVSNGTQPGPPIGAQSGPLFE